MRIVALLQTYNERRFIARCIEHLVDQGVQVYVVDNESTDGTLEIAERYVRRGVIGLESLPRHGVWNLGAQFQRKQELAASLDADWLIHLDADEVRISPDRRLCLADELRTADEAGFNAVNFLEFTFMPTVESPDHDHPDYERTMQWYYPFLPGYPHRLNAWRRQDGPIDLVSSAGHRVAFPHLRMSPRNLYMRHYLFLGVEHALEKYVLRGPAATTDDGNWLGWRTQLEGTHIELPHERQLRRWIPGEPLDRSEPFARHLPFH
jgi:glycosyltransferase involved in cell wall biosynthesis